MRRGVKNEVPKLRPAKAQKWGCFLLGYRGGRAELLKFNALTVQRHRQDDSLVSFIPENVEIFFSR